MAESEKAESIADLRSSKRNMAASQEPLELAPDIVLAKNIFSELAEKTGGRSGITRASYGEGEQLAHDIIRREGNRLGLNVETDAACNLYVTFPGEMPNGRIIIGSHLDSVPRGGNFDGAAGVLCGLSVLAGLARAAAKPRRDITLMAIRAEESTWFPASYIGSRAAFGLLTRNELDEVERTSDGLALGDAIAAAGGNAQLLREGKAHLSPVEIGQFIEPHIEQGPCLVMKNAPVGVVTGIRGSLRYRSASCRGCYAHSGATPRRARRDAVRATAALVMAMDKAWDEAEACGDDLAITFGKVFTDPEAHAFSKVAGRVEFSFDARSESRRTLDKVEDELLRRIERISECHSVRFDLGPRTGSEPAAMSGDIVAALQSSCVAESVPSIAMPCGAGHDAAVFAQMGVPSGMLFIRNENGSHNPNEHMEMEDFAVAARVLMRICVGASRHD
ncbi:MAG: hydantoinase/carbamoylase family amidase [Albidovulum sp.]|nr:hydantoinase/carbamoylase family amidase [Albidovulum sp.]